MARNRIQTKYFWKDARVAACQPLARLLLIGMKNFCDDQGVHPVDPKKLRDQVFPHDDFRISEVEAWLEELIANGLVTIFEANNRRYWYVANWDEEQKVNRPSRKYPAPPHGNQAPSKAAKQPEPVKPSAARRLFGTRIGLVKGKNDDEALSSTSPLVDTNTEAPSKPAEPGGTTKKVRARQAYPDAFERCWAEYPRRPRNENKKGGYRCWAAKRKQGVSEETLEAAARNYCRHVKAEGIDGTNRVMMMQTFYGPDDRYEEFVKPSSAEGAASPSIEPLRPGRAPYQKPQQSLEDAMALAFAQRANSDTSSPLLRRRQSNLRKPR